jgi:hypothetical protein
MYSKEEATQLRQQFWITFGKYMKPIPSAGGLPINWVNYKTGVKHVWFKMNAEQHKASISIVFSHPDRELQLLYFEQFTAFKNLFKAAVNEEWEWNAEAKNEFGVAQCQVSRSMDNCSIYNQQNWPSLISFLKPRLIALDQFWEDVKPIFEEL